MFGNCAASSVLIERAHNSVRDSLWTGWMGSVCDSLWTGCVSVLDGLQLYCSAPYSSLRNKKSAVHSGPWKWGESILGGEKYLGKIKRS